MIISCLIHCHSLQSILKSLDQSPPCLIMCCVLEKDNLPSGGVSLCLGKQMIAGKLLHQRYLTKFWKVEPAMGQHPIYRRRRRWGVTILVVALFQ